VKTLGEVIVYVSDMDAALGFYRDVLGLEADYVSEHWTTFRTGECSFCLHPIARREPGVGEPDPTFMVDDLDGEHARLAAAGVEVTEIREPVPGARVFDATDPEGNRFSLEQRS
jgi:predicted enzyme related to lactoylglutathione lyase